MKIFIAIIFILCSVILLSNVCFVSACWTDHYSWQNPIELQCGNLYSLLTWNLPQINNPDNHVSGFTFMSNYCYPYGTINAYFLQTWKPSACSGPPNQTTAECVAQNGVSYDWYQLMGQQWNAYSDPSCVPDVPPVSYWRYVGQGWFDQSSSDWTINIYQRKSVSDGYADEASFCKALRQQCIPTGICPSGSHADCNNCQSCVCNAGNTACQNNGPCAGITCPYGTPDESHYCACTCIFNSGNCVSPYVLDTNACTCKSKKQDLEGSSVKGRFEMLKSGRMYRPWGGYTWKP